jgi:hypothetical protein
VEAKAPSKDKAGVLRAKVPLIYSIFAWHQPDSGSFPKPNTQKSSGDNENAILWTPLLITFAQMDMVGP